MGLYEKFEDVLCDDGPMGETANRVVNSVVDCLDNMANTVDDLVAKLGEIGDELSVDGNDEETDRNAETESP
jgi:hypothetical protein